MKAILNTPGGPKPVGPYSPAVEVGNLLFLSGQIGIDPSSGQIVAGGIEEQTRQVLSNLKAVLAACGSSPDKIVMSTVFLTDIAHGKVVNGIYGDFVNTDAPPARQTVAVKDLPMGAIVEISVIAVKG